MSFSTAEQYPQYQCMARPRLFLNGLAWATIQKKFETTVSARKVGTRHAKTAFVQQIANQYFFNSLDDDC